MRKVTIPVLYLIFTFNLAAQSLPDDLRAAVKISESGSSRELLNTMSNFKETQRLRLGEFYKERDKISADIVQKRKAVKNHKTAGLISLAAGALAGGAFIYFAVLGNEAYDNYQNSIITADAVDYREEFQRWDFLSYVSLGVVGAGAGLSALAFSTTPSMDSLNNEYTALDKEIRNLEGILR